MVRPKKVRLALADDLEHEWPQDATDGRLALFLGASRSGRRAADGCLAVRTINAGLEQIGQWQDAELAADGQPILPLRPHDLRHTLAFQPAQATGADADELERRLGHRSQRSIQRFAGQKVALGEEFAPRIRRPAAHTHGEYALAPVLEEA